MEETSSWVSVHWDRLSYWQAFLEIPLSPAGGWSTRDMQFVSVQVCVRLSVMRGKYVPHQLVVCGGVGVLFKGEKKARASKGPLVSFPSVYQFLT